MGKIHPFLEHGFIGCEGLEAKIEWMGLTGRLTGKGD